MSAIMVEKFSYMSLKFSYMYLCWGPPRNYVKLAHLHIQYGCQHGNFFPVLIIWYSFICVSEGVCQENIQSPPLPGDRKIAYPTWLSNWLIVQVSHKHNTFSLDVHFCVCIFAEAS